MKGWRLGLECTEALTISSRHGADLCVRGSEQRLAGNPQEIYIAVNQRFIKPVQGIGDSPSFGQNRCMAELTTKIPALG